MNKEQINLSLFNKTNNIFVLKELVEYEEFNVSCVKVINFLIKSKLLPKYLPEKIWLQFKNKYYKKENSYVSFLCKNKYAIIKLDENLNKISHSSILNHFIKNPVLRIQYVFLHELGHIVFYYAYKNQFFNNLIPKELINHIPLFNNDTKLTKLLSSNVEESFADIFAAHILRLMSPINKNLLKNMFLYRNYNKSNNIKEKNIIYNMSKSYEYFFINPKESRNLDSILFSSFNASINNLIEIINNESNNKDFNILLIASLSSLDKWNPDKNFNNIGFNRINKLNKLLAYYNPKIINVINLNNFIISNEEVKMKELKIKKKIERENQDIFYKLFEKIDDLVENIYIKILK